MNRFFVILFVLISVNSSVATESCQAKFFSLLTTTAAHSDLPKSAAVVALGLDSPASPLHGFAKAVEQKIKRRVVTYLGFKEVHYISESGKWWERSPRQATAIVEKAVRRVVKQYPHRKIIAFNLDGFDPKRLVDAKGREVFSFTNFEVRLLLSDPHLFSATRWYLGGRELNPQEVKLFWGNYF